MSQGNSLFLSRRRLLTMAASGIADARLNAANPDFWNRKAPADWSSEEIDRLLTKSPWAKEAPATYGQQGTGHSGWKDQLPFPIGRGRGGGGPAQGSQSSYVGTVRWESAQPVLDAVKSPLPEDFAGQYVISVSSIPLTIGRGRPQSEEDSDNPKPDKLDDVKQSTTLQFKGKDPVMAVEVQQQISSGTLVLFGFPKAALALGEAVGEVDFASRMGSLFVKARFNLKEMQYHGTLAV
jgi:hypothetical protein